MINNCMKVLWITNILFGYHHEMLGIDSSVVSGGSWLYAAYDATKVNSDIQLHIVTVSNVHDLIEGEKDGHYFYILPGGGSNCYDINSARNIYQWEKLRDRVDPDVVIVWGTEKRFSYLAMTIMKGIPMAIYMQGVIGSIYQSYYEGVPFKYQNCTLRDYIDKWNPHSTINTFKNQVILEQEMLKMATGVIVENDWCEDVCRSINNKLFIYRNPLPIREVFSSKEWSIDRMKRHTIFTNAGGYPIKGHHILFKALGIVKKQYPDFKCYIPGPKLSLFDGIKRRTGFTKYLNTLIKLNGLEDNVIYLGPQTAEQMVEHILLCNVYVMPSVMENHSASLIEAMYVGVPCISSLVGGTANLVRHKENGLLYNSLDGKSLAGCIIRLFENDDLANTISRGALRLREQRKCDFGHELVSISHQVISDSRCI